MGTLTENSVLKRDRLLLDQDVAVADDLSNLVEDQQSVQPLPGQLRLAERKLIRPHRARVYDLRYKIQAVFCNVANTQRESGDDPGREYPNGDERDPRANRVRASRFNVNLTEKHRSDPPVVRIILDDLKIVAYRANTRVSAGGTGRIDGEVPLLFGRVARRYERDNRCEDKGGREAVRAHGRIIRGSFRLGLSSNSAVWFPRPPGMT